MSSNRNQIVYPKTLATILQVTYYGSQAGKSVVRLFTPEEWEVAQYRFGKRRYYFVKRIIKIQIDDTGEILELDNKQLNYAGKRMESQWQVKVYLAPGRKIKMFKKPPGSERWMYKLQGE